MRLQTRRRQAVRSLCLRSCAAEVFFAGRQAPQPSPAVLRAQSFVHEHKDKGAMRAELERWVVGLPLHIQDYVTNTPDEHLYLSIVGDRCAAPLLHGLRVLICASAWRVHEGMARLSACCRQRVAAPHA